MVTKLTHVGMGTADVVVVVVASVVVVVESVVVVIVVDVVVAAVVVVELSEVVLVVVVVVVVVATVGSLVVGPVVSLGQGFSPNLNIATIPFEPKPVMASYSLHRPVTGSQDSTAQSALALHNPTQLETRSVTTPAPLRAGLAGVSLRLHLSL